MGDGEKREGGKMRRSESGRRGSKIKDELPTLNIELPTRIQAGKVKRLGVEESKGRRERMNVQRRI